MCYNIKCEKKYSRRFQTKSERLFLCRNCRRLGLAGHLYPIRDNTKAGDYMKGKKFGEDIKEKAYALYAYNGSFAETGKALGVAKSTVKKWIDDKKEADPDGYDELRYAAKKDFIEKATDIIDSAMDRLAIDIKNRALNIPVKHLSTVIGTLYDKRALARGESTENTSVTFDLPKEVEDYAD